MIIRSEQTQAFADDERRRFEVEIIEHLKQAYPHFVWRLRGDPLIRYVRDAVDRALAFGIDIKKDISEFVDFTFELGEHFESDPRYAAARQILTDSSMAGSAKVEAIRNRFLRV